MIQIEEYMKLSKDERQRHLVFTEPCLERPRGPMSEETKRKMSCTRTGMPVVRKITTCPHCSAFGVSSNMTRYHFNNCKSIRHAN
jgi:hypothetical protein